MTSSKKPRQFGMKSQLNLIARGLFINNHNLFDLSFKPLTRKHEIRGDAFSKSLSIVSTKIYDKRDDFDFDIVNFPFLDGDVSRRPSYGEYISQLIRFV